jgi:sugar phosphate isomerase/epimerase
LPDAPPDPRPWWQVHLGGIVVKLGVSFATYWWVLGAGRPRRDSPEFDALAQPAPYFSFEAVAPSEALEWMIGKADQLGLSSITCAVERWSDAGYLARIRALLQARRVQLLPSIGANYAAEGAEADAVVADVHQRLLACRDGLGTTLFWTCASSAKHNRWRNDPPVGEQLRRMKATLARTATRAEDLGVVLALENHADYRGYEIVEVIDAVDSPSLRASFDSANPLAVCEDPVDAAKVMAPYAVTCHLKDLRVVPYGPTGPQMLAAPVGRGNVDVAAVLQVLREKAPDPTNLALHLEISWPPANEDMDLWVRESARWVRAHCGQHLDGAIQPHPAGPEQRGTR